MVSGTVIAIDGPAASGKSSVARLLAARLGLAYVNSGAMYRAVTWWMLRRGADADCPESVLPLLPEMRMKCGLENGVSTLRMDGADPGSGSGLLARTKIPSPARFVTRPARGWPTRRWRYSWSILALGSGLAMRRWQTCCAARSCH